MIFDSISKFSSYKKGVYLAGFPFDKASSFRKGAGLAPNAIRSVSDQMELYSPTLNLDLSDFKDIYDCGNVSTSKQLENLTYKILKSNGKLLLLGGDHSVALGIIKEYLAKFSKLLIIHLDAHADLRNEYLGDSYSHACVLRRVVDFMKKGHKLIQLGIRSGLKEEFLWMKKNRTLSKNLNDLLRTIKKWNGPIYMTLDVDFFDPGFCPGTGTPEAGGYDFNSFLKIIKLVSGKNFIGADITELAPNIDNTGNSTIFVCKLVREVILALRKSSL